MRKDQQLPKPWTKKQEEQLKELYPTNYRSFVAKKLNRSIHSIRQKANELGLVRIKVEPVPSGEIRNWTKREEKRFTKEFPEYPNKTLSLMYNRSLHSIKQKARALKLRKKKKVTPLTEYEKEYIFKYYNEAPVSLIAKKLKRNRDVVYKALNSKWFQRQINQ